MENITREAELRVQPDKQQDLCGSETACGELPRETRAVPAVPATSDNRWAANQPPARPLVRRRRRQASGQSHAPPRQEWPRVGQWPAAHGREPPQSNAPAHYWCEAVL